MKKINAMYQKYFDQSLLNHKLIKPSNKVSKQAYMLLIVFVVVTVWFMISLFNLFALPSDYQLELIPYLIALVVLLIGPLVYIAFFSRKNIIITEKAVFKQVHLSKYKIVPFEKITKVATDHENKLVMITDEDKVKVMLKQYRDELKPILDVLRFRGFFKEDPKAFEVVFENGNVIVREVVEMMTKDTSMLFEKYISKYTFLTPGFIDDIIFYNTQIDRIQLTLGKHVVFYLTHVDVKPTHPENTHFKAQKSDDAIVIFEDIDNIKITLLDAEGDNKTVTSSIQSLRDTTKKAVIFDATLRDRKGLKMIDFTMSQEVKRHRVSFSYSQVIVGWNKLVENSWFEKS